MTSTRTRTNGDDAIAAEAITAAFDEEARADRRFDAWARNHGLMDDMSCANTYGLTHDELAEIEWVTSRPVPPRPRSVPFSVAPDAMSPAEADADLAAMRQERLERLDRAFEGVNVAQLMRERSAVTQ